MPIRIRFIASLALVGLALLIGAQFARPTFAQSPDPAATPDVRIATLEFQVSAQATQLANHTIEVDQKIKQVQLDVTQKYLPWTIAATVLGLLGLTLSPLIVVKYARDRAQKLIDQAIYKIDPVHVVLHVPDQDFEIEHQFLARSGFYQIETYTTLDNTCLEGCVVVLAPKLNEDPKSREADISRFRKFLVNTDPQADRVGYVIYTKWQVDPTIVDRFPNITFANSPVTLGTNVFTIGRSLTRSRGK